MWVLSLTLSTICDYFFGTAYVPHNRRDIKLDFPGVEQFPVSFIEQNLNGFNGRSIQPEGVKNGIKLPTRKEIDSAVQIPLKGET